MARNQLNCEGSRPHSRINALEGVVSLPPRILFNTIRQPLLNCVVYLSALIIERCGPNLDREHDSKNCIGFVEPDVSVQPAGKVSLVQTF